MGRKAIPIEKDELQKKIQQLTKEKTYSSRSVLYNEIAKDYHCSGQVIYGRVRQFELENLIPIVPIDKKNFGKIRRGGHTKREPPTVYVDSLTAKFGNAYPKLVARCLNGSLRAKIKLNCIDCSGGEYKEVKYCTVTSCPFWSVRPGARRNTV